MKILTVDDYQRVRLPADVKPRTKLAYERAGNVIMLTEVVPAEPQPVHARLIKKNGHTIGTTDRPVPMETIRKLLAEFP
jgi:hypothetical protein